MNHFARALVLLLLSTSFVPAASPREELLRYVPSDTSLCVLVQGLRDCSNTLANSPFFTRLAKSPLGKHAENLKEVQQLLKFDKHLEQFTGLTSQQLRDDVLGDLIVLAYKAGPPGKPEQEEGLILVHARDAKMLAALVQHINDRQKQGGELKGLQERVHRGQQYVCRQEAKNATFYYLRDRVLLFTGNEAAIRRAIDQRLTLKAEQPAPLEAALERLGVADSLVAFWVDPRAFDEQVLAKLALARNEEAALLRTFHGYWKALDGLALALQLDRDVTLNLAITAKPELLPTSARRFFGRLAEPSKLWQNLPEEPLLALTARLDLKALLDLWLEFLPAQQRQPMLADLERYFGAPLGKDFVRDVLPAIGPDVSLVVTSEHQQGIIPAVLLALRVSQSNDPAPIDQALWSTLNSFATILVIGHNQKNADRTLVLKRISEGKLDIRSLVGDSALPTGFQPSYALTRGHLVLGSSPTALRTLSSMLSEDPAPAPVRPGPIPMLVVSFKAWREFLNSRKDMIVRHWIDVEGLQAEDAASRMSTLLAGLEYVDRLEVRHRPAEGRMLLQVSLQTRWPLK